MSVQLESEVVISLRAILRKHLQEWRKPWPGHAFGKTIIGNSLLGALERHGCDRGQELQAAVKDVGLR